MTIVTTLKLKDTNSKHILLEPAEEERRLFEDGLNRMTTSKNSFERIIAHVVTVAYMTNMQYNVLKSSKFRKVLKEEKYDLLLLGYFFNDFQLAIAAQLNIPVLISWLVSPFGVVNSFTGNPNEMSYVPNLMVSDKQPMNFGQRLTTFLVSGVFYGLEKYTNYKYEQYYE